MSELSAFSDAQLDAELQRRRETRCPCFTCDEKRRAAELNQGAPWYAAFPSRMFICETCGNKRCPHSTHHDNPCTGSNEPGQDGSRYPAFVDEAMFDPEPVSGGSGQDERNERP